jgi:hypothetical protein
MHWDPLNIRAVIVCGRWLLPHSVQYALFVIESRPGYHGYDSRNHGNYRGCFAFDVTPGFPQDRRLFVSDVTGWNKGIGKAAGLDVRTMAIRDAIFNFQIWYNCVTWFYGSIKNASFDAWILLPWHTTETLAVFVQCINHYHRPLEGHYSKFKYFSCGQFL